MSTKNRNNLHKAIGASYSILGSLALFGIGGYWLDKRSGEESFWLIIGLLLGTAVGLYELAKYVLKN